MIALTDAKWADLSDAYNHGEKIPALLDALRQDSSPKINSQSEPWFSLWSSLCHQGDVYSASFAVVPHLADIAAHTSAPIAYDFFLLPAYIEIARDHKNIQVPEELAEPYYESIKQLSELASHYIEHKNLDPDLLVSAQGMLLVGEGKFKEAEHVLDPEVPIR